MKTEYRIIFTATFDTDTERNKMYDAIKTKMSQLSASAIAKRADMTKDEYQLPEPQVTEKVI